MFKKAIRLIGPLYPNRIGVHSYPKKHPNYNAKQKKKTRAKGVRGRKY